MYHEIVLEYIKTTVECGFKILNNIKECKLHL